VQNYLCSPAEKRTGAPEGKIIRAIASHAAFCFSRFTTNHLPVAGSR
jgi:hypothetical protein